MLRQDNEYMVLSHICSQFSVDAYRGEPRIVNLVFPYSQYHLIINREEAYLNDGLSPIQDSEYQGSIDTFIALLRGEKDPYKSYGSGEIYVTGDRMFFFELNRYFRFDNISLKETELAPAKIYRGPFNMTREFSFIIVTLSFLQIWLGWVFSFNSAYTFLAAFIVQSTFSLYYFRTDKLTRIEIFMLFYLGISTILFFTGSTHYQYYYHIYFLLASLPFFIGSFYSPIRNILSQYNSFHSGGLEIINPQILRKQRKALVIWCNIWFALVFFIYMGMNTSMWRFLSESFLTGISLLFCGIILLNIFAINGLQPADQKSI